MCGRYTMFMKPDELKSGFKTKLDDETLQRLTTPRYNVAPSQDVPVITSVQAHPKPHGTLLEATSLSLRECAIMRWGLIPSWAKDESIGNKLINARAETLLEKPSFRAAFQARRCLIPVNGFYEWQKISSTLKQPMYVHLRSKQPFAVAGLWESWQHPSTQETVRSCTIITTTPNSVISPFHHRMAAILTPEEEDLWLDESLQTQDLIKLLRPYQADEMEAYPVSTRVNTFAYDDATLIERVEPITAPTVQTTPLLQHSLF